MIQGIFASNQGMVGDRTGDFANAVLQINPTGTALFLALTSGMQKAGAADTIFTWFEDSHISGRSAIVSGTTTTTIVVADGSFYVPGTVLLIEDTGERVLVTATSGNSLTVVRGMGGTTITSVDNTMFAQSIGNAHEEASGVPTAVTQQGSPRMNYTQIFRNSWAITGTAKAVAFRTGSRLAKNKRDCAMYHAEDMERAFIWGVKHVGVLNGNQFRMTDGILAQIENYGGKVLSANSGGAGQLAMDDLQEWMRDVFSINVKGQPNERIAICGDLVLAAINKMTILDSTYNISQGESKVGIDVTTVTTPFGKLKLMTHPLMNENPTWQHELYCLHPGAIRRRMLRDTFEEGYDKNGNRLDGIDADQGVITTECGIEVGAASTMGILENVQTAVATS
jgi:hypothetical protein